MLDFRRLFQEEEDLLACSLSEPSNTTRKPKHAAETAENVHLVDFTRAEASKCDARFPQVDDILDRLDIDARTVAGASRPLG